MIVKLIKNNLYIKYIIMTKILSDKTINAIIEECSKSKYRQKVVDDILTPIVNDIFLSY